MVETRVVRTCDACAQTDDHPRHVIYSAARVRNPLTSDYEEVDFSRSYHLDCCPGCTHCAITLRHAGGKKGPDLVGFLVSADPAHHAELNAAGFATATPAAGA